MRQLISFFAVLFLSLLASLMLSAAPLAAQSVNIITPEERAPTILRNETGLPLRLHVFYGHDTARLIAFHEHTLNHNQYLDLDELAGVSSDKFGGKYYINVWHKGGGALGLDAHWKSAVEVWGSTSLQGRGNEFHPVTPEGGEAATIWINNTAGEAVTAYIYNSGDTIRAIAAFSFVVGAGKEAKRQFFTYPKYGLSVVNAAGTEIYSGVVDAQREVRVINPPPQVLKVGSFNVKLMVRNFHSHAATVLDVDGHKTPYRHRLHGFSEVTENLTWQAGGQTHSGMDVIGFQEVWRQGVRGEEHLHNLQFSLMRRGFDHANIHRGTGQGLEKGFHHGLIIASRYPIIDRAEMKFADHAAGTAEAWVEKGALFARISVNGVHVAVFNTHLQADEGELVPVAVRAAQLKQLRAFIAKHARSREPIILLGDFNIKRDAGCKAREYCSWRSDSSSYGGWTGFNDNMPEHQRYGLDYIFSSMQNIQPVGRIQEDWLYLSEGATLSRQNEQPESNAEMEKITDHPLIYGAFVVSPRG